MLSSNIRQGDFARRVVIDMQGVGVGVCRNRSWGTLGTPGIRRDDIGILRVSGLGLRTAQNYVASMGIDPLSHRMDAISVW